MWLLDFLGDDMSDFTLARARLEQALARLEGAVAVVPQNLSKGLEESSAEVNRLRDELARAQSDKQDLINHYEAEKADLSARYDALQREYEGLETLIETITSRLDISIDKLKSVLEQG